jgi:hypothetical protein
LQIVILAISRSLFLPPLPANQAPQDGKAPCGSGYFIKSSGTNNEKRERGFRARFLH